MKSLTHQYNGKADEVSSHREKLRETLSKACENIDIPYVLAVKGGYGTGKTSFLKHLQADLEEHKIATIWFDAWQSDHIQDPFAALMASFDNQILEKYFKTGETRKNILNTAKKYSLGFSKFALKAGGKILAGSQAIEELFQFLQKGEDGEATPVATALDESMVSFTQHFAEKFFNYKEFQRGFDEFKTQLTSIAKAMEDESKQQKIVIFVDELDRCRPDYAIEVLEVIKHFFDAKRVVFILSICEQAMKGAVSSVYHADVDYVSYMNKFINSSFSLPKIPTESYWQYMQKQESCLKEMPYIIHKFLPVLMEAYNVSLRDQNRIFSALYFMHQLLPEQKNEKLDILNLFYAMKLYINDFPKEYEEKSAIKLIDICAKVPAFVLNNDGIRRQDNFIAAPLVAYLLYNSSLENHTFTAKEYVGKYFRRIDKSNDIIRHYASDMQGTLLKEIEKGSAFEHENARIKELEDLCLS